MRYDIDFLFCVIDDFCKMYEMWEQHRLIPLSGSRRRSGMMSLSELMTIMVLFHVSPCKNFKWFYLAYLPLKHGKDFPNRVSYTRFVALQSRLFLPLQLLLHSLRGEETGLYFMDATSLPVCHNKRIKRHRVFDGSAKRGRTTMGWFFGFKLHVAMNHKGQIMAVKVTAGNTDDRDPVPDITKDLKGLMAADKGYISNELFDELYRRGLKLLVGIRKNMKNHLMPIGEKILLRKRFIIETLFDILKHETNLWHTRHRSPANAMVNLLSALVAYTAKTNKPALKNLSLIQN